MKRLFMILSVACFVVALCYAMPAEAGCDRHVNYGNYIEYGYAYFEVDDSCHVVQVFAFPKCNACGSNAESGYQTDQYYEYHYRNGNVCIYCDARLSQQSEKRTMSQLQDEARMLGDEARGGSIVLQYDGHMRTAPNEYSTVICGVTEGDTFLIMDYSVVNDAVWFKVKHYGTEGWISAAIAEVELSTADALEDIDPDLVVGAVCEIIAGSANTRAGVGAEHHSVSYVKRHQRYTITDFAVANTGKVWYQIDVDGKLSWISSGLVDIVCYSAANCDPITETAGSDEYDYLVGRRCRIVIGSGQALSGPGEGYSPVGVVRRNEKFDIHECQMGDTGKVWYKIRVAGRFGWISSGIAEIIH